MKGESFANKYSRASADGKCILDLTQSSVPSHARPIEVIAGASIIQSECVDKALPPYGGQAIDMGTSHFDRTRLIRC